MFNVVKAFQVLIINICLNYYKLSCKVIMKDSS